MTIKLGQRVRVLRENVEGITLSKSTDGGVVRFIVECHGGKILEVDKRMLRPIGKLAPRMTKAKFISEGVRLTGCTADEAAALWEGQSVHISTPDEIAKIAKVARRELDLSVISAVTGKDID